MSNEVDWRFVAKLGREVGTLAPSEAFDALALCVARVRDRISADSAGLACTRRVAEPAGDPLLGWRIVGHCHFGATAQLERVAKRWVKDETYATNPHSIGLAQGAGHRRVATLRQLLGGVDWEKTPGALEFYASMPIEDQITCAEPIGPECELILLFSRTKGKEHYSRAEIETTAAAIQQCSPTLRSWAMVHGYLFAETPLTPRERDVLAKILGGESKQEIADAFALSERTVHHVVSSLLTKFRVHSQRELVCLWTLPSGQPPAS